MHSRSRVRSKISHATNDIPSLQGVRTIILICAAVGGTRGEEVSWDGKTERQREILEEKHHE
jgi:hypothetical protein